MQGRLLYVRWEKQPGGQFDVTAKVKTQAGRRADVRVGVAASAEDIPVLIKEANERFPRDGRSKMEERT